MPDAEYPYEVQIVTRARSHDEDWESRSVWLMAQGCEYRSLVPIIDDTDPDQSRWTFIWPYVFKDAKAAFHFKVTFG